MRRYGGTEPELERADPDRDADIQPARSGPLSRPSEAGAASQIDREHTSADDLKPGMARIHLGIGQGHVAAIVLADERERHRQGAFDAPFTFQQIERAAPSAQFAPQAAANRDMTGSVTGDWDLK